MSNNYTPGSSNGASGNNAFSHRREMRASNVTGALPSLGSVPGGVGSTGHYGSFDFEQLILSLRELFEQDRQVASQTDSTRCGICYLHFTIDDLHYREEGFYVCKGCERALSRQSVPMLRKQQKM